MAQKRSNYVPVGRRGIFGGVILNMHLHWKKHETVKVICKPCKPGQLHEYANEIARLSGGIPIHMIGDDTIIFYRGKDYVQPEVMSPVDTLSKKRVSFLCMLKLRDASLCKQTNCTLINAVTGKIISHTSRFLHMPIYVIFETCSFCHVMMPWQLPKLVRVKKILQKGFISFVDILT